MCVPDFPKHVAQSRVPRNPPKPRIVKVGGRWHCGKLKGQGPQVVEFPVGIGPTPRAAYLSWREQR